MSMSFLPVSDSDRLAWLTNFKIKLAIYASTFGLTPAEVSGVVADHAMYQYVVNGVDAVRLYLQSLIQLRRSFRASMQAPMGVIPGLPPLGSAPASVQTGIFTRISALVQRIKHHPGYTTAIGQDLGIIAPVSTFNPATMKPELTVKLQAGYPVITYTRGDADGIKLYVDRRDGNGFVLLDKILRSKYIDVAPLPANTFTATVDYKGQYIISDDDVGLESDVVTINIVRL